MSTLIITYNKLNDFTGAAKNLNKKIDKRIDDYEDIRKKVRKISTNRNNLTQTDYFIRKKQDLLNDKVEKIDEFKRRIEDFKEEVQEADKRVARRIKNDTKSFKKANNINVSVFSYIGIALEELAERWYGKDTVKLFETLIRNAKYEIKDWYYDEGGKYVVNILVDVAILIVETVALVGAVVTGVGGVVAALGVFFAAFSTYKSTCDIAYDVNALVDYHETGNRVIADRTDQKGGREATVELIGDLVGDENAALMYDVTNIASAFYSLYKVGTATKGVFESLKNHQLSFENVSTSIKYYLKDEVDNVVDLVTGDTTDTLYDSGKHAIDNVMGRIDKKEPTRITLLPSISGYTFPARVMVGGR